MAEVNPAFRRVLLWVLLLNFGYFGIEFVIAQAIGSVALFADSIDFLEDAAINGLILIGLGWGLAARATLGLWLSGIILIPSAATLWMLWQKVSDPIPPEAWSLSLTGLGALIVNLSCAFLLVRFRHHQGSLTRAAFLSARNDALANVAIIAAGLFTLFWPSSIPDALVGIGIFWLNLDAARAVYRAARQEQRQAKA